MKSNYTWVGTPTSKASVAGPARPMESLETNLQF